MTTTLIGHSKSRTTTSPLTQARRYRDGKGFKTRPVVGVPKDINLASLDVPAFNRLTCAGGPSDLPPETEWLEHFQWRRVLFSLNADMLQAQARIIGWVVAFWGHR
jgi:hypothetical protein